MKKLTVAATLVAGAIASHTVQAQLVANDLYMGFQNAGGGGTSDYIINLGPAANLLAYGSFTDLSSDFSLSTFLSGGLQGTNSATIVGGVVGASNAGHPSDVFVTQFRSGLGDPGTPGSTAPSGLNRFEDNQAYSDISQLAAPASGSGALDSTKSWEKSVESGAMPSVGTLYGDIGVNPDSSVSQSTVLYEDLWETSNGTLTGSSPFVYEGYFTLDITGGDASLTFTAVPEPSGYLISGVGGILTLLLRSRLWRRNA